MWLARGAEYVIDWDLIDGFTEDFPVPDPLTDWERHLADVDARTIPLPVEAAAALEAVEEQVERLLMDSPLAALKAAGVLERLAKRIGAEAAEYTREGRLPGEAVGQALRLSESAARSRLLRYRLGR